MSIKIYKGWRWPSSDGFFPVIKLLQDACKKTIENQLKKLVIEMDMVDNIKGRVETAYLLSETTKMARTTLVRTRGDMNMVFFIREAAGHYLMMPEDSRRDSTLVDTVLGKYYYGFWNNADKPKNISKKDWSARGEFWKKYWKPATPCVTFSALDAADPFIEIFDILCPDTFGKKIPKDYWTVEMAKKAKKEEA